MPEYPPVVSTPYHESTMEFWTFAATAVLSLKLILPESFYQLKSVVFQGAHMCLSPVGVTQRGSEFS